MKLKLSEIHPNPYKKLISDGKLNQEQIDRIKVSLDELGLMDSIPVVKIKDKYHCVSHHHRVEAMKQKFGKDYEVDVSLHDYTDDQLFRGMVVENLTQRKGDFHEEIENIVAIREYLRSHPGACSDDEQARKDVKGVRDAGSVRDISDWLNKHGQIMAIGPLSELLKMNDTLAPELLEKMEMTHVGDADRRGEVLSKTQGVMLSSFDDKKEQKDLAKALLKSSEGRVREQSKLLTKYKEAPEEEKKAIRKGKKDLALVGLGIDVKVPELEKSVNQMISDLRQAGGDFSARLKGFQMKVEDGDIELTQEQKDGLAEYMLSLRQHALDEFVKFLSK